MAQDDRNPNYRRNREDEYGWSPPKDNRDLVREASEQQFLQAQGELAQRLRAAGVDPTPYLNVTNFYDPRVVSQYKGEDYNHQTIRGGHLQLQNDGTVAIDQLHDIYRGSGAEFQGIPFAEWLQGPSSPWRLNPNATGAYYEPSKQTVFPEYNPKDFSDMAWLVPLGVAGAGLAYGGLGALGGGAGGAGASAGGTGAAAGGAGGGFALAPPGTGIGGVGTAGLGLSGSSTSLLTPELIAAGGGAGAFTGLPVAGAGTGAGLGLALTPGNAIVDAAAGLAQGGGVTLPPPVGPAAGSGAGAGLTTPAAPPTPTLPNTPPTPPTQSGSKGPLEDLTTGSKIVDSIIGGGAAGAIGGAIKDSAEDEAAKQAKELAEQQRREEEERQRRIAEGAGRINEMFGEFDDPYFEGVAKAYRDHYNQLIGEQARDARRAIRLGWPGGTDTSGYARRMGDLTRDVERQYADVSSRSVDFANQRRSDLEGNRSAILSALEGGAGIDTLANQAAATAARISAPPAYSPLGDLFARLTSIPANRALARAEGYDPKPLRFNTGKAITITG